MRTMHGSAAELRMVDGEKIRVRLKFFNAQEARVIAAACERIFPADESGPGAAEAGVVVYIDRQLAGPYGSDKYRYTKGPFVESVPEHGYQGKENPQQIYRSGIALLGADFDRVDSSVQDTRLQSIQDMRFFQILRAQTIEGMFCDPLHGGNMNLAGWKLIGYPGPLMSYRDQIGKFNGQAWRQKPMSLSEVLGRPVKGWEETE